MLQTEIYGQIIDFLKSVPKEKIPLIVILGPTASGKTAFSVELALQFSGEIISADSRQVYKYMDIATAKIKEEEKRGVKHHLIDVVDPDLKFTTFDFKKLAEEKIEEIHKKSKIPFLVGGTGLYIRSITDNFDFGQIPPNLELRKKLEKEAVEFGKEYVWKKLNDLDPIAATKIHFNNLRYVVRGIERAESQELTCPNWYRRGTELKEVSALSSRFSILKIGIEWSRELLYDRINKRVDEQIKEGLIEETKLLLQKYDRNLPSMTGLGYPQIAKYLDGEMSLEDAKDLLKKETRHYAKRQMTWFGKEEDVLWIDFSLFLH